VRLNEAVVETLIGLAESLRERLQSPPVRAEHLLALRGVIEIAEPVEDEETAAAREAAMLDSLSKPLPICPPCARRKASKLEAVIVDQIDRIAALTEAARPRPSAPLRPSAPGWSSRSLGCWRPVRRSTPTGCTRRRFWRRKRATSRKRSTASPPMSRPAATCLTAPEAVGRKFDFLAQEFNREANTLCAKAYGRDLTRIGLELKSVIDQLREQVQNLE
jgi:uncharacterized protein YicC (UPF0701 family)